MQPLVKKRRRDMDIYMYIQIYHINASNWKKTSRRKKKKATNYSFLLRKGRKTLEGVELEVRLINILHYMS